jgi:signal transduction histidine kinase
MSAERLGAPAWRVRIQDAPQLGPAIEDGLYRIAQEAVANVQKHAEARTATLALACAADRVELSIDDDGRGFSPGQGAGMGLRQMDERARSLGGELRVKSHNGRGTRVEVIVPLLRPARAYGSLRGKAEEALP